MKNTKKGVWALAGFVFLLTGWTDAMAVDSTSLRPFAATPASTFPLATGTTQPLYLVGTPYKIYDATTAPPGSQVCPIGMKRSLTVSLSQTDRGCSESGVDALFVDCNFESQQSYSIICGEARLACADGGAKVTLNWVIYCRP